MNSKTDSQRTGRPPIIRNNCRNYEYEEGRPLPESETSCRGCKNSFDPDRYDPGCKLLSGYDPRN